MRAVPFRQSAGYSVFDHLKMMETSAQSFPPPATGLVQFSADITASTPGISASSGRGGGDRPAEPAADAVLQREAVRSRFGHGLFSFRVTTSG